MIEVYFCTLPMGANVRPCIFEPQANVLREISVSSPKKQILLAIIRLDEVPDQLEKFDIDKTWITKAIAHC